MAWREEYEERQAGLEMRHLDGAGNKLENDEEAENVRELSEHERNQKEGDDALSQTLSAFYCKLLVVLGIAFPVTEVIAPDTSTTIAYDGFYLFLYLTSIVFLLYMYATLMREEDLEQVDEPCSLLELHQPQVRGGTSNQQSSELPTQARPRRRSSVFGIELATWRQNPARRPPPHEHVRYGSFYLRMGMAGFGVGSVIFSGLEFGRYLERRSTPECRDLFQAVTPLCRIAFILVQMLFIFTNNKLMEVYRYKVIARFGLMHMIATNLCEWLYVLVEETKHDMLYQPTQEQNFSSSEVETWPNKTSASSDCYSTNIMASLLADASPYLFPCTVEYSLLCAVILAAMWKNVKSKDHLAQGERKSGLNVIYSRSLSYFSVDCASAYKGLFTSIVLMVLTIISLIMFFQLVHLPGYTSAAVTQVNVWECVLFASATCSAVALMFRVQRISIQPGRHTLELEHVLLVVTQSGVFLYCVFQVIGGIFSSETGQDGTLQAAIQILVPLGALIQSACQTLVLLDASRRRCDSQAQIREKPGRQLVTFLLVANLAIWAINRLKNSRVEFKPAQTQFYGRWAWAVITHVCVPLVVCYRFQSTVCLYEIWKRVYKMKANYL